MKNNYCVYIHKNKTNGKVYVGMTNNVCRRWRNEGIEYKPPTEKDCNRPFWNAICKHGWNNFEHKVILENLTKDEACKQEKILIEYYNSRDRNKGYNIAEGGNGGTIYIDHPKGMKGKSQTLYQINSHREWSSNHENNCMTNGKVVWNKTHKHPRGMLGKKHTEKHNMEISKLMKEKKINCKKVLVIYPNNKEVVFDSLASVHKFFGVSDTVTRKIIKSGNAYVLSDHVTSNIDNLKKLAGVKMKFI